MDPAIWRGDCERCAALCCLSLAFDRSELFACDKAAGVPCSLLEPRHRCAVHGEREARGWGGCAAYDCLGAGQRVTQEVFGGRSWRDEPALIRPMMDAFWVMRGVQEARQLVHLSARLPLTPAQAKRRDELERALQPEPGGALAAIAAFERGSLPREVSAFLASLRETGEGDRAGGRRLRRLPLVAE
jgi:hypothetical protein